MDARESQSLVLRDGRRLGYAEYGDPAGLPIIAVHGTPGSRLTFRIADRFARDQSVRLIAPDRPGYGISSAQKNRNLEDWSRDVSELADHAGIGRYSLIGVSGGGPHAVAPAALDPERVSVLALVCPLGPIADPGFEETVTLGYRIFFKYLARVPGLMGSIFTLGSYGFRFAPWIIYGAVLARATPNDWRILMRYEVRDAITKAMSEGLRRSVQGGLGDVGVFKERWDLPLDDIRARCVMWQGLSDRNVPVETALRLGELLPGCKVHTLPKSGHYWIFDNIDNVIRTIVEEAAKRAN